MNLPIVVKNVFVSDRQHQPKTDFFCCCCCKDLNPRSANVRYVHIVAFGSKILHPRSEAVYKLRPNYTPQEDYGHHPVGPECAKQVGRSWLIE